MKISKIILQPGEIKPTECVICDLCIHFPGNVNLCAVLHEHTEYRKLLHDCPIVAYTGATAEEMTQKAHEFLESITIPFDATWGDFDIDKIMVEFAIQQVHPIQSTEENKSDAGKLRKLAEWLDVHDLQSGIVGHVQVQNDLRRIADKLEAAVHPMPTDEEIENEGMKQLAAYDLKHSMMIGWRKCAKWMYNKLILNKL